MHDTENRMNQHAHAKTRTSKGNPSKMACEKASRRLKAVLVKASRLGITTAEVARLPTSKKFVSQRDHGWKLVVLLCLMFGGGVIVALICTTRKGCSRIEDIGVHVLTLKMNTTVVLEEKVMVTWQPSRLLSIISRGLTTMLQDSRFGFGNAELHEETLADGIRASTRIYEECDRASQFLQHAVHRDPIICVLVVFFAFTGFIK